MHNWPRNPENFRLDGIFDAFAAGGIVSGSFSCGDRRRGLARLRRLKPNPQADTGRPGEALSVLAEAMVAALEPGDHGLRRSHRLGDPFLRLVGVAARLDDRGDGELVFQRVMGRDKIPGPSATPARALGRGVFPALVPPSPISGPWGFRSSHAFRNTAA